MEQKSFIKYCIIGSMFVGLTYLSAPILHYFSGIFMLIVLFIVLLCSLSHIYLRRFSFGKRILYSIATVILIIAMSYVSAISIYFIIFPRK